MKDVVLECLAELKEHLPHDEVKLENGDFVWQLTPIERLALVYAIRYTLGERE